MDGLNYYWYCAKCKDWICISPISDNTFHRIQNVGVCYRDMNSTLERRVYEYTKRHGKKFLRYVKRVEERESPEHKWRIVE